jgi:hypothetical protein
VAIAYGRAQIIGRSDGRSAVACAAYRAGQTLEDQRQGITHDYERKRGVLAEGVMLPANAPEWMRDRAALWNAVERREDRQTLRDTAQLAREFVLALPHELDDPAREYLVQNIIKEGATRKGMIADYAIHEPNRDGNDKNYHAHIMLTMRHIDPNDPDGFGNKAREWNSRKELQAFKGIIERETNRMLKRHGIEQEITFVLEEGKEAQRHMGHRATHLERKGIRTEIGDENRAIEARNQERAALREQAAEIERQERTFLEWVKEEDAREAALRDWTESLQTDETRARAARWRDKINRAAVLRDGFAAAKEETTQRHAPERPQETHQSQGDRDPHGTAAMVGEYLDLCQDPAKDLRRWTDATHTPRRDDADPTRATDEAERQAEQDRQAKEAEAKAARAAMIERLFQQAEERRKRDQEQGRDRGRTLER